jgi:hypothetical protein
MLDSCLADEQGSPGADNSVKNAELVVKLAAELPVDTETVVHMSTSSPTGRTTTHSTAPPGYIIIGQDTQTGDVWSCVVDRRDGKFVPGEGDVTKLPLAGSYLPAALSPMRDMPHSDTLLIARGFYGREVAAVSAVGENNSTGTALMRNGFYIAVTRSVPATDAAGLPTPEAPTTVTALAADHTVLYRGNSRTQPYAKTPCWKTPGGATIRVQTPAPGSSSGLCRIAVLWAGTT